MNRGYGLGLDSYNEQEMVEFAGLVYGGQDTWNFNYADYVDVYSLNDSPTWTLPGVQQVDKNQSLAISGVSVIDVDAGNSTLQVSLSAQQGVLTVGSTADLQFTTGDGSADSQLVFTGTLANLNTALGGLVYQPAHDFHGGETIQLSVNDQGNTGAGGAKTTATTLGVTVNNVNTPPVATADRYIVPPDGTLQVILPGILANDHDDDGQAIVPAIVAGPFKGILNLATDGSFTYT
ncbi:MAG: hypothetical protein GY917_32410, partial [Planctomycetaceae bacterium]|nr:hypothetical protein [Planctomycetaceae bacterium]